MIILETTQNPSPTMSLARLVRAPTFARDVRASSSSSSSSSRPLDRLEALTSLPRRTLEDITAREDALDAKRLVRRMTLLRELVARANIEYMIDIEPGLISGEIEDEDLAESAREVMTALEQSVPWENARLFLIEREPSLLLERGGSRRMEEIRAFFVEHEDNVRAIAGDGASWLDAEGQRFLENWLVDWY